VKQWHVLAVCAVLFLFGVTLSLAHTADKGWDYDTWCCNTVDCRQLADDDVTERGGGWYVKSMDVVVPYDHPQRRISGDEHYHLCELPKGTVRCFYVPPGGA
jgi:hypothetical protein